MNVHQARRLIVSIMALVSTAITGKSGEYVTISSTAAPPYIRSKDANGHAINSTYIVAEGKHFESNTVDKRMSKTTLPDVLKLLAPGLTKQHYIPAPVPADADIIIVIHWGSTVVYEDPLSSTQDQARQAALEKYKDSYDKNGIADPGELNELASNSEGAENSRDAAIYRNAMLLGYAPTLEKLHRAPGMLREEERRLRDELNEERYFIVLMAYDYKAFKQKDPKLLWVTRMSVRSAGTNFTEALPMLSEAGARVYGQQLNGLKQARSDVKEGHVTIGEMKTVDDNVK